MKKIIIMSDSHGYAYELKMIRDRHEHDYVFHCGDSERMAHEEVVQGMRVVEGNCDKPGQFNVDEIVDVAGVRFFLTHGHLYNVKQNVTTLSNRASEVEADVVCFGHSHIVHAAQEGNFLFLNPGSIRFPRDPLIPTYVVLEVEGRTIHWSLWSLDGQKEAERTFTLE